MMRNPLQALQSSGLAEKFKEHRTPIMVGISVTCSVAMTLFRSYNEKYVLLPRRRFIANDKICRFLELFEDSALREAARMDKIEFASGSDDCENLKTIETRPLLDLIRAVACFDVDKDLQFRVVQVARVYVTLITRYSLLRPKNLPVSYVDPVSIVDKDYWELMQLLELLMSTEEKNRQQQQAKGDKGNNSEFDACILKIAETALGDAETAASRAKCDAIIAKLFMKTAQVFDDFKKKTEEWKNETAADKNKGKIGNFYRSKRRHLIYCTCIAGVVAVSFLDDFATNSFDVALDQKIVDDGSILSILSKSAMAQTAVVIGSAMLRPVKAWVKYRAQEILKYEMLYELSLRTVAADTAVLDSIEGGYSKLVMATRRTGTAADVIIQRWTLFARYLSWGIAGVYAYRRGQGLLFTLGTVTSIVDTEWIEEIGIIKRIQGVNEATSKMRRHVMRNFFSDFDEAVVKSREPRLGVQLLLDAAASKSTLVKSKAKGGEHPYVALGILFGPHGGDVDSKLKTDVRQIGHYLKAVSRRCSSSTAYNHLAFLAKHLQDEAGATGGLSNAEDLNRVARKHLDPEEWTVLRLASSVLPNVDFVDLCAGHGVAEDLRGIGLEFAAMYKSLKNRRDAQSRDLVKEAVNSLKEDSLLITFLNEIRNYVRLIIMYHLATAIYKGVVSPMSTNDQVEAVLNTTHAYWFMYERLASNCIGTQFGSCGNRVDTRDEELWKFHYFSRNLPCTIDDCFSTPIDPEGTMRYRDLEQVETLTPAERKSTPLKSGKISDVLKARGFKLDQKGRIVDYKLQHEIEFYDVSFAYPTNVSQGALNKCSFVIKNKGFTGILGPSGGGKSTVFKLLTRLYDPLAPLSVPAGLDSDNEKDDHQQEEEFAATVSTPVSPTEVTTEDPGLILVDGIPNYLFSTKCLRALFATVSQGVRGPSNNVSVAQFIAFNAPVTKTHVIECCKKALCHDVVMKLPNQYDTVGARFSGGESQRLSIARSLVRNPDILLLDEATAALDAETEQQVQQTFDEVAKTKTLVVIAHRLSTLKAADHLIVIEKGRCLQEGTHDELIKDKSDSNLYRRYLKEQALGTHGKKKRHHHHKKKHNSGGETAPAEEEQQHTHHLPQKGEDPDDFEEITVTPPPKGGSAEDSLNQTPQNEGATSSSGGSSSISGDDGEDDDGAMAPPSVNDSNIKLVEQLVAECNKISGKASGPVDSFLIESLEYHASVVDGFRQK